MGDGLHFASLGIVVEEHAVLWNWSHVFSSPGLTRLVASPAASHWLGRLLARHQLPETVRIRGQVRWNHLDWRICPAAIRVGEGSIPLSGTVATQLVAAMPAPELLELLSSDPVAGRSWVERRLIHGGVGAWDPDRPVSELTPEERMHLGLLCAVASDASVIFVELQPALAASLKQRHSARLLEETAQTRLVILAGAALVEDQERGDSQRTLRASESDALELALLADSGVVVCPDPSELGAIPEPPADGLRWLIPDRLAGMGRPGTMRELSYDLDALARHGVGYLICLEESAWNFEHYQRMGIEARHEPIVDMEPPSHEVARILVDALKGHLRDDVVCAVHCRAGLGRTGTILAAYLIDQGYSVAQAMGLLRQIHPQYVQSDVQHRFLEEWSRGAR
ncbi:MAG: dual specificity protein phosphatase family protein [Myxococcota bacterium]